VNSAAPRRALIERSWRYTLVGAICAVANNLFMIGTDLLGGHYLLGTFIAFLFVTPIAYLLHSWFTFGRPLNARAFARFTVGVATAYPIAACLMVVLCSGLRFPVVLAAPIATVILFVWNFMAAHWTIVRRLTSRPVFAADERCDAVSKGA
jgi:putative flippase GtrA